MKKYHVIGNKDFTIKLNSYCLQQDSLEHGSRYVVYNSIGEYMIVKANDLVESSPDTTILTYMQIKEKKGWAKEAEGKYIINPLNHWVNIAHSPPKEYELVVTDDIIPDLSDLTMHINSHIPILTYRGDKYIPCKQDDSLTPIITISGGKNIDISGLLLSNPNRQLFNITNNSRVKLTNINISGGQIKNSFITISGDNVNVDIFGFKFTGVSGQLFDITNSTVNLTNIDISGGSVKDSSGTADIASSLISYRIVDPKPNFFTTISSDTPPAPVPTPPVPTPPAPVPTPPAPVPTPPAPSESRTLTLTDICINMITYGVRGIIEIDGAKHVDISHLIIHDCHGAALTSDVQNYVPYNINYKESINTLWSPLTLLNTSATIMNSDFSDNNQKTLSFSAQAITSYNSSINIYSTNFTMAREVIKNYINTVSNPNSYVLNYWDEASGQHSIPMIRNYDISTSISKKITIKECDWWTGNDLSNINYLYFFVDKQGYTLDLNDTEKSKLTISNCTRNPSFNTQAVGMIIPNINVYSNRVPLNGSRSQLEKEYDITLYNSNDILNTKDFYIGNWYMLKPGKTSAVSDTLLKFTDASESYQSNVYGLNRDILGYDQQGMELYYINNKQTYLPELTGLICVDQSSQLNNLTSYSLNTCGSQANSIDPFTWDSDYEITIGYNAPSCKGRCTVPTITKI